MSSRVARVTAALVALCMSSPVRADEADEDEAYADHEHHHEAFAYGRPRDTRIPGRPGPPGAVLVMLNAYGFLLDVGLGSYVIENEGVEPIDSGKTRGLLTGAWGGTYYRDAGGWFELLAMLNFDALSIGDEGYAELGQQGTGLWDAQAPHMFFQQVLLAFHPLAGTAAGHPNQRGHSRIDLSLFAGQGGATLGPPIYLHRASAPGPTVPRKHHKGENPHETLPVLGASLRLDATTIEASVFNAEEPTPADSRFRPHANTPDSYAARVRQELLDSIELQLSGARLRNQGSGQADEWQLSASAYAWSELSGWRFDGLLDYGVAVPERVAGERDTAHALLGEIAVRDPARRDVIWLRSELNQREEPDSIGGVSSPWWFSSLGFERVLWPQGPGAFQLGMFGEATYGRIPASLGAQYGRRGAFALVLGLHASGTWIAR